MRGGAFLKGKEGRVGFRRSLKVQGRTGGFSKKKLIILWLLRRKPLYLHRI